MHSVGEFFFEALNSSKSPRCSRAYPHLFQTKRPLIMAKKVCSDS